MKTKRLSSVQKIALSFILVILMGSFLLYLPITHNKGYSVSYIDSLFIATSATCVTGLTPLSIAEVFNPLGKFILLLLIQFGGLGFITIIAWLFLMLKNKISIRNRQVISDLLNREQLFEFKTFVFKLIKYTVIIETAGAVLLSFSLVEKFGFFKGFSHSIFLSISAFCNAGFDIFGGNSLLYYKGDIFLQIIIMVLIILGGLGFVVWSEVVDFILEIKNKSYKKAKKSISIHTKIVLNMTLFLILFAAIGIYLLEYQNPEFLKLSISEKISALIFQSVTLRTAGFSTLDFANFRYVTLIFMIPIMFIGGASGGTAGGVKITTFFVIISYIYSLIKGKSENIIYGRKIDKLIIIKSFTFFFCNVAILFVFSFFLILNASDGEIIKYLFEGASALGTVGISAGLTSKINFFAKVILIFLMYVGRIGIMTFVLAISNSMDEKHRVVYPNGKIIVG